jgi:hypothetical protein
MPILHFYPRVVKAHEPMGVQALAAELAVEAFDIAVIPNPRAESYQVAS